MRKFSWILGLAFVLVGGLLVRGGFAAPASGPPLADGVIRILIGTIEDQHDGAFVPDGDHRPVFVLRGSARTWYPILENEILEQIEELAGPYRHLGAREPGKPPPEVKHKTIKVEGRFSSYRGQNYFRITTLLKVLDGPD